MPIEVVLPRPPSIRERFDPLLAQDASYFAASARIRSLACTSIRLLFSYHSSYKISSQLPIVCKGMTILFTLLLMLPQAISARNQPREKPPIVLEKQVKSAKAARFAAGLFAAERYRAPYRIEFRLLDGGKVIVTFEKPESDAKSVSWRGRIEGSKFGTGTIVLYETVVSGSLRLDDGRVFELVTAGRDVWMREIDTALLEAR